MGSYTYSPLDNQREEIRLISLLPGTGSDDLRIHVLHRSLLDLRRPKHPALDLQQAMSNSPGWKAYESLDHRILLEDEQDATKWYSERQADMVELGPQKSRFGETTFEALSYVCEESKNQMIAYVLPETTAATGQRTVAIRSNLDQALRHLRDERSTRLLWVDQICINQGDNTEKGHQIASMSKIYETASRVVVWLGPESANSSLAMATLEQLGKQVSLHSLLTTLNQLLTRPLRPTRSSYHRTISTSPTLTQASPAL